MSETIDSSNVFEGRRARGGHWGSPEFQLVADYFQLAELNFRGELYGFRIGRVNPDAACDLDWNGICDAGDINLMLSGDDRSGMADLTGDGVVDNADRDEWLSIAATENGFAEPYLVGDSNLDGIVDAIDLNEVGVNWLNSNAMNWSDGNYSIGDEAGVNAIDLNALATNWQSSISPRASAVPEPSGQMLFGIAVLLLLRIGRRAGP